MASRVRKKDIEIPNGAAQGEGALTDGNLHTLIRSVAAAPAVHAKELKNVRLLVEQDHKRRLDRFPFFVAYSGIIAFAVTDVMEKKWGTKPILPLIGLVALLQILTVLFSYWSVDVRSFVRYTTCRDVRKATHVKVTPADYAGQKDIVPLELRRVDEREEVIMFEYRRQRFLYNPEGGCFDKLKYPTSETFNFYRSSKGFGSEAKVLAALQKWGPNKFEVPVPLFFDLLAEQLLAPFFVFQVFCVGLWCLDDYMVYSLFTLGMLVLFECTVVTTRRRQIIELRAVQTPKLALQVYRQGKWERLPGDALLPGDLISIGVPHGDNRARERVVPADLLLLAGTCIVEEAVLTGESTPQWKTPLESAASDDGVPGANPAQVANVDLNARLVIKRDKNHVLFGGTKILQHQGDKGARVRTPDNGCLAVVLRTGFETAQGRLMRTILFSTERVTANNWETGLFILFLLVFAVSASAYVAYHGLQDPDRDHWKLMLNCIMIVTSVIPPELPMELSIAVNTSLLALVRKSIYCTEPFRITLAGKVAVCCFDKTGTLTSDDMVLMGIAGLAGQANNLLQAVKEVGMDTLRVLAGCHSLIYVDGELMGDPLERATFQATGWSYTGGSIVSPRQGGPREQMTVLHRFQFTSALKRMACLLKVEADTARNPELYVVMKGAPEMVAGFLADVPDDYEPSYKRFASQGGRVIALAYKKLDPALGAAGARALPREELESGLNFVGFAVLQCPLKEESEPALRQLRDASHQLVMITGDAPLTAVHAASRVHIVDRPALILQHKGPSVEHVHGVEEVAEPDAHFEWVSPDEATRVPFSRARRDNLLLASEWDLCVSGEGLHHLHQIGADMDLVPITQVFARVSPDQKELILRILRSAGWVTLMCGDGTNDVGALKSAHVGVALLAPRDPRGGHEVGPSGRDAGGRGRAGPADMRGGRAGARGRALPAPPGRGGGAGATAGPGGGRMVVAGGRGGPAAGRGRDAGGRAGAATLPGAKMLEEMRRQGREPDARLISMAEYLDQINSADDSQVPMVKPGEASMAAPFTAKQASVMPCTDILKQGRCTLVTTVQMFKILGLLCLSTAYSLSVQYLQGVKLGDLQATTSGMMSAALFFALSMAQPLPVLSPERPHPNIFCAYVFLSILGQCALHLACLVYCYRMALSLQPKDEAQAPDSDFKPNLVNTVCFLVNYQVQLTTFAVNYIGHPFNTSLYENKYMFNMLRWGTGLFVVLALDMVPGVSSGFSLVTIPHPLDYLLVGLAAADFILATAWERFLRQTFPAEKPPQKAYLAYSKELAALKGRPALAAHAHTD